MTHGPSQEYIDKMTKWFPEEMSKKIFAPSFDETMCKKHDGTMMFFEDGNQFLVDNGIYKIMELIHAHFSGPITSMSCEHDFFGWAGITFDIADFNQFIDTIYERAMIKYGSDITKMFEDKDNVFDKADEIFKRVKFNFYISNGDYTLHKCVNWEFDRADIPEIERILSGIM